jgi:hypothetical protein
LEQVDLHLCLGDAAIFIKPLPAYLLDSRFWSENLCSDTKLYESARGLLLSYAWIISREVDFKIAQDKHLLPCLPEHDLTWNNWVEFISTFLGPVDLDDRSREGFDQRYQFGELRVRQLNLIYRLAPDLRLRYLFKGYHFGHYQFDAFFRRNFSWLIVVFAYLTIILTGMQLGLATNKLNGSEAFQWASYVFAVYSIMIPVVAMGILIWLLMFLSLANIFNYLTILMTK